MLKLFSIFIITVFLFIFLPSYANVVDPVTGLSTCEMIQSSIDSGEENPWITNYILENPDEIKNGKIEIIDSDCIYTVNVDAYFDKTLVEHELTSEYDGVYDLKFINKEDESQKFVVEEIITIQNGEIIGKGMFVPTHEYSGFVDADSTVFLLNGPCIDSNSMKFSVKGYFYPASFDENNVATGSVRCDSGCSGQVCGTWILTPTGGNIEGFTQISFGAGEAVAVTAAFEDSQRAIDCEGLLEKGIIEDLSECDNVHFSTGLYYFFLSFALLAIPVAGIIGGLWLYKKRKKQGKIQ